MKKIVLILLFSTLSTFAYGYENTENYNTEIAFEATNCLYSCESEEADLWIGNLKICLSEKECFGGLYMNADIYRTFNFVHPPVGNKLIHESYEFTINSLVEDTPGYFNVIAVGFNQNVFSGYIDLRDIDNPKLELKDKKSRIIKNISSNGLKLKNEYTPGLYLGYE